MKKLYFLLAGFVLNLIFSMQITAQSNFFRSYNWPEVTEETKDAAYDAPASKIVGKWIDIDGTTWTFNTNGTFEQQRSSSIELEGLETVIVIKGRWNKKGEILNLDYNYKNIQLAIAPASKAAYSNLSSRKKNIVQEGLKRDVSSKVYMYFKCEIVYITSDMLYLIPIGPFSGSKEPMEKLIKLSVYEIMTKESK